LIASLFPPCPPLVMQLSRLTNLRALEAVGCPLGSGAVLSSVTALPSLQSLQLRGYLSGIPSWLSRLTGLRQLAISEVYGNDVPGHLPEGVATPLQAALLPLRQLTCLALQDAMLQELPEAVAGLPLRRLVLGTWLLAELPTSCAMLGTLRWMGLPWEVSGGMPAAQLGQVP